MFGRFRLLLLALALGFQPLIARAQISKGNQILIDRGLQIQGIVSTYDTFTLSTFSNANYTTVNWLWADPRSYSGSMPLLGPVPGFPWARWVSDETDMPPKGDEGSYLSQLVSLQLADEWDLNDGPTRMRAVNWVNSVSTNWPNTLLAVNNGGGQVSDGNLIDFVSRAQVDIICFDTYPWKSVYDTNQTDHIGSAIPGPPTTWYSVLRIYRDISRAFNIPFGSYVQTFHSVEEYYPYNVYRDPSPSELRLNHFGALAFNGKMLIDFHYNNGSSALFTAPGGDSNPNALYYEKVDCALRARNFGKALVRLKPIDEATSQWTTSVVFIRGRSPGGALNAIPLNFYAGPVNGNLNTDWLYQRNDPYLTNNWLVTNQGSKNNGQPGDVIIAWFKLLDESFDGPGYNNEVYLMVLNGLSDPTGTAADCLQRIELNLSPVAPESVDMLNPVTGQVDSWHLPLVNGLRQLVLNLNGGDAALFKFSDGAPFAGVAQLGSGPPVIAAQPKSLTTAPGSDATFSVIAASSTPAAYQWRFNGVDISGATTNAYTRTNAQVSDAGSYSVVATNSAGSVTSAPAVLTLSSLILYEPFDYTNVAGPVSSNSPANWTYSVGTGANDLNVAGGNLSWSGLATSIGNSVTNGGAGLGVRRLLGRSVSSGVVYFSALFRMNNLGYGAWNGLASQVGALTATDNGSFRLQVMVRSNSPAGYVFGVQKGSGGTTFDTTEYHMNDTVFLAGKYDFNTSPNTVTLWINPSNSTFGSYSPPATGLIFTNAGADGFTIDRFNIRQNVASGPSSVPAAMQWDELRFGNLWADVTPPGPTAVNLLNPTRLNDGRFQFAYTNSTGAGGSVYASTNLVNWTVVGVATQASPDVYQFTDGAAPNFQRRFYQLRLP